MTKRKCTEKELKERIKEVFMPLLMDELEMTAQMECKRQCHNKGVTPCESHEYPLEFVEEKLAVFQSMRKVRFPLFESVFFAKGHVHVDVTTTTPPSE